MIKLIKLITLILITFLIILHFGYQNFKDKVSVENETILQIKKWDNFYSLSKKFNINNAFLKIYLKLNPVNQNLQAWKYKIKAWTKINNLFEQLKIPINETDISLTILEWWNIYDIDNYLTKKSLIKKWDFIKSIQKYSKDMNLITQFNFLDLDNLQTLEWFLYPDTYYINPNNFSSNILINKMLNNFKTKVYNKILKWKTNKEIYNIINLASIVEKEERNNTEKSTVAWILKKRLENKWMIGADITVCYPHKLTSKECKMVVSKYINEKSDYNTRTMIWLPKTPISNPNFDTINAVINYKKSSYWYYLHDTKTWKIYYGKTNAEHEKNKRLYLK